MAQPNDIGRQIAWAGGAVALVANIGGYAFDLYQAFWWFDRVLHSGTMLAITFWLAVIVFAPPLKTGSPVLLFFLIAAVGVAIGALWEVAEWVFDMVAPSDVIKGKNDTVLDIIMDTIGALIAACMALYFIKSTPSAI